MEKSQVQRLDPSIVNSLDSLADNLATQTQEEWRNHQLLKQAWVNNLDQSCSPLRLQPLLSLGFSWTASQLAMSICGDNIDKAAEFLQKYKADLYFIDFPDAKDHIPSLDPRINELASALLHKPASKKAKQISFADVQNIGMSSPSPSIHPSLLLTFFLVRRNVRPFNFCIHPSPLFGPPLTFFLVRRQCAFHFHPSTFVSTLLLFWVAPPFSSFWATPSLFQRMNTSLKWVLCLTWTAKPKKKSRPWTWLIFRLTSIHQTIHVAF